MKSTDEMPTPAADPAARGEIDDMLKRWPEVAVPTGGYDALAERAGKAIEAGRAVDEGLDVFARPGLPAVPGEPAGEADSDGPKLETLAALARESALPPKRESRLPEKASKGKDPRSGVINLKAMIEQAAAQETEAGKLASALTKDGAPSMGAPGATAATHGPAATTQPSTPVAFAARPPEKKSSSSTLALAAIVVIAGVGAYVMLNKQEAPPAEPDEPAAAEEAANEERTGAARDQAAEDRTVAEAAPVAAAPAPSTSTATSADEPSRAPTAEPARGRAERSAGAAPRPAREPNATVATAAPAEPPAAAPGPAAPAAEPPTQAPTKRSTQDLDALISGSLGPGGAADPAAPAAAAARTAAPEGALPQPNRQQIQRGMGRVAGAVRACANGQTGMVMLRITFMSDGSVSAASVASGPFAGSGAAGCMENAARAARVPAFVNASVTVSYPIMVQPPDPAADAPPAP